MTDRQTADLDMTHAIVLAAGRGSRLDPEEGHKLVVEIGGRTLLSRHLDNFRRLGVRDVTVVVGYRHPPLERAIEEHPVPDGMSVFTAVNPAFDGSNGLSVLAGVRGARRTSGVDRAVPFWLTMGDHVFEPGLFERLAGDLPGAFPDRAGAVLAVDRKIDTIFDLDDANGLAFDGDRIDRIGKELEGEEMDAVDVGLFGIGEPFVEALEEQRRRTGDCDTSDAVRALDGKGRFATWDVGPHTWQDVDTPQARAHADELARSWEASGE
ncbi:MAG: NTP transferase domain-containing protein [Bradymonadaceae bacterium]